VNCAHRLRLRSYASPFGVRRLRKKASQQGDTEPEEDFERVQLGQHETSRYQRRYRRPNFRPEDIRAIARGGNFIGERQPQRREVSHPVLREPLSPNALRHWIASWPKTLLLSSVASSSAPGWWSRRKATCTTSRGLNMGALGPDGCISQFSDVDLRGGFGLTLTAFLVSVEVRCLPGVRLFGRLFGSAEHGRRAHRLTDWELRSS
jgi:hypothetical protein